MLKINISPPKNALNEKVVRMKCNHRPYSAQPIFGESKIRNIQGIKLKYIILLCAMIQ